MGLPRRALLRTHGSGRLPDDLRAELVADRPLLVEEGLLGSMTLRRFRAPGFRSAYARDSIAGAIAVTERRLVVRVGRHKEIDVPRATRGLIEVSVDKPGRVCFGYDAGRFHRDRSGRVEVRLRTERADEVVGLLA